MLYWLECKWHRFPKRSVLFAAFSAATAFFIVDSHYQEYFVFQADVVLAVFCGALALTIAGDGIDDPRGER